MGCHSDKLWPLNDTFEIHSEDHLQPFISSEEEKTTCSKNTAKQHHTERNQYMHVRLFVFSFWFQLTISVCCIISPCNDSAAGPSCTFFLCQTTQSEVMNYAAPQPWQAVICQRDWNVLNGDADVWRSAKRAEPEPGGRTASKRISRLRTHWMALQTEGRTPREDPNLSCCRPTLARSRGDPAKRQKAHTAAN